ncbi:MAG: TetR/AcrR family transcriptional regulator [Actinomycetales bacterium]
MSTAAARVERPAAAERLLEAASQAFADKGFHATTTRDIAARAEMSPAAVYVHFATKEALLYELSLVGHRAALGVVTSAIADAGSRPAGQLTAVVRDFAAWHATHRRTARVVQYELTALTPGHRKEITSLRREIQHRVRIVLESGVREGRFVVPDVPGTALALLSLVVDVARWYRPDGPRSPDQIGALYADLALRMVTAGSPPGPTPVSRG